MILRRPASLLLSLLALPITLALGGCTSLQSITVIPAAGTVTLTAVGQTAQFTALGVKQMGNGEPTTNNITTSVSWSVSNPSVATINASGLATAVGAGTTQVTAISGGMAASSDLTVSFSSSGGSTGSPTLTVTPGTATETFVGETTQFIATGSLTGGAAQDLTTQVQWISSNAQVATITSGGLATTIGAGTTTITAKSGGLTASAVITVSLSTPVSNATLAIIPTSANATFAGETTQFIAIGSLTGGAATTNLTNNVAWSSSDVSVATIDQYGLATAQAINKSGNYTTITAIGTSSTGSVITASATLQSVSSNQTVILPTLTVYLTGLGTGTVSSSPGTLLCGSAAPGAGCTNNFALNATVTLTAAPATGSSFAGWSSNCSAVAGSPLDATSHQPLQCTIAMSNNETVGAIFK